ncbi:alkaline phosphatase D family protein [Amycolatopsis sp. H20-H5]|uniref:alkaline phosphatase D family protein n=1 Tax=Amycolatopsis sp. H20-H5 TaxID=3046309 RepID=UPI002DBFF2CF|nr:alkaline phosphatase D family protein [Amycolatopsis sp. H20-H5]MEC3981784.1 alkaline phosphatase D family protein [Amycolatopsis sp. H20-H5]
MGTSLTRRSVLRAAGVTVAGGAVSQITLPGEAAAEVLFFAHGVASGDPLPDSVLLWTRVTPAAEATPGSGLGPRVELRWEVATDAGFEHVVARGRERTGPECDHTVHVSAAGLRPSTGYYYRFTHRGQTSPVGRTRTAPRHDADLARLRFGVVSCANWFVGHFAPYGYLASRDDLDAVIHLGDYLYEMAPDPATDLRPNVPAHELVTLADYRQRHANHKTDAHVRAVHLRHPLIATWDDHEAADNAWSGGSPSHDPATEGPWAARMAAAHQAYFEWMPVRHRGPRLYRRLKFGKLVDLTMLDLRSYRTQQPEPGSDDPAGTILGAEQRQWFLDGLTCGSAGWNLIGNSVMIAPIKVPALPTPQVKALARLLDGQPLATTVNTDQWDGYTADRRRVLDALVRQGKGNTVFLTGDIHSSWANDVPLDAADPTSPAVAAEFVCTSITSDNFDDLLHVPPRTASLKIEAAIRALNPHVQSVELDSHGPSVLEVTPGSVQFDWYYVADRRDPATAVTYSHSFRTTPGNPHVVPSTTPIA